MLSYGCHGNNWGHWGGWLNHQVGGAGHRVWLRGHMWVMGRRHAHAIGHLGFRLVLAEKGPKTETYPYLLHGWTTSPLLLHVHPMHIMHHWTNLDWLQKSNFR